MGSHNRMLEKPPIISSYLPCGSQSGAGENWSRGYHNERSAGRFRLAGSHFDSTHFGLSRKPHSKAVESDDRAHD